MFAKLIVKGKEFDIEILDDELKNLVSNETQGETGYERKICGGYYWITADGNIRFEPESKLVSVYEADLYHNGNYYTNKNLAENHARADRLYRKLRRFAAENGNKKLDTNEYYTIEYNYAKKEIACWTKLGFNSVGLIRFSTEESAEKAIIKFQDELMWYFEEYKTSL